jgi:hypothetical protein
MITSVNKITWLIVVFAWVILQVVEFISPSNVSSIQLFGWIGIFMIVGSALFQEKDWRQRIRNGMFWGGVTMIITLALISFFNHYYAEPKREQIEQSRMK